MAQHFVATQLSRLPLIVRPVFCNGKYTENASVNHVLTLLTPIGSVRWSSNDKAESNIDSPKMQEFKKKLRERTPIGKLETLEEAKHPYQEKEPLKAFPDNTNPATGEVGGPRGPEPTRYGDWERKGRVTDF